MPQIPQPRSQILNPGSQIPDQDRRLALVPTGAGAAPQAWAEAARARAGAESARAMPGAAGCDGIPTLATLVIQHQIGVKKEFESGAGN